MLRSFFSLALIVAMSAMLPVASAFSAAPQSPHPAGCHHAPASPSPAQSPAPPSFQCCVNGHHAAMPSAVFRHNPATRQSGVRDEGSRFSRVEGAAFLVRVTLASSPPGAAPLRI